MLLIIASYLRALKWAVSCVIFLLASFITTGCSDSTDVQKVQKSKKRSVALDQSSSEEVEKEPEIENIDLEFDSGDGSDTESNIDKKEESDLVDSSSDDQDELTDVEVVEDETIAVGGSATKSLTLRSINRNSKDGVLSLRYGETEWVESEIPDDGRSTTMDMLCVDGAETLLEMKFYHPDVGEVTFGSEAVGKLATTDSSVTLGFEVRGSCNGPGCQDDIIVVLSCPDDLTLEGA